MKLKIFQIDVCPGKGYELDDVAEIIAVRFVDGTWTKPYDTSDSLQARLICRMEN